MVVKEAQGCSSSLGMQASSSSKPQTLSLMTNGCFPVDESGQSTGSTVIHEFLHALGVFHTQSRKDRGQYVTINYDNIKENKAHNFDMCKNCEDFDVEYDPYSFMHYSSHSWAVDKTSHTIQSKVGIHYTLH